MRPPQLDEAELAKLPANEQKAVRAELKALERALAQNPLGGFEPHAKQAPFLAARTPIKLFAGGNRCLDAAELVRMADGAKKPIAAVEPGEWVFGVDHYGATRPVRVLRRFDNGPRSVSRFTFGKRETEESVVATDDHRILARHEKWGAARKVPASEMGASWRTRSRHSAQRAVGYDLPPGPDEEWATLFGLLLGDGCVSGRRVQLTAADPAVVALARRECERLGLHLLLNRGNPIQYVFAQDQVPALKRVANGTFAVGSRNRFLDLLEHHGIAVKAHEKRLPPAVWRWSNEGLAALVAGLLLTDGSVFPAAEGWRVSFTSTSAPLAEGLRILLAERFGVYGSRLLSNPRPDKERPEHSFTIGNYASLERLAAQIPLAGRKRELLDGALASWRGKRSDGSRLRFRRREPVGVRPTCDLLVDHPDHMFLLANGLVVSNSGKTTCGVVDNLIQTLDREDLPEHLLGFKKWDPPFYCRMLSPDLIDTMEAVLFPKLREWCPPRALRGGGFDKAYSKQTRILHFENGSWWQFMSYEQDVAKMGGAALHRCHYDEEPPQSVRHENQMRLLDFAGDEVFTMTPLHGMTYIFDDVYERAKEVDYITVVEVDMDDNPHIDEATKLRTLAEYSGEERRARKSGQFVSFAGLIYADLWDSDRHVLPEAKVPPGAEVYVGIDPGMQFMCGVVWAYLTPADDLVIFDEFPASDGQTIGEVATEIHKRNALHEITPRWYVIDPASRNRNNQTGRSDQMEFADHGIVALPGQNAVLPGISAVKDRLRGSVDPDVVKPPKLFVMAHCEELIREFKRYRWKAPTKKREQEEDDRRSGPVKKDDHLLDALRYLVMSRPLVPDLPPQADTRSEYERLLQQDLEVSRARGTVQTDLGAIYA